MFRLEVTAASGQTVAAELELTANLPPDADQATLACLPPTGTASTTPFTLTTVPPH